MLTPLHYAAWFNASDAVECLIENGADVESSSAFGQKPLHYVVSRASVELVEVCQDTQIHAWAFSCFEITEC